MKVSLKWLKEYVNVRLPVKELAHRLNMSGTEVGSIETIGGQWQNILVGRVETVEPHPNADRLKLATVDLAEERATVVCGAPNIAAGQKIAFAKVGARLIDGHSGQMVELKPATIRGVVSAGMVCSEKELGISEKHEGIMVLPPEAPVGTPLAEYLGDTIFDLDITPNRPDCLSMLGVAREVAAITYEEACLPAMRYSSRGDPIEEQVSVEIADPDLCPRYCASLVSGVKVAPSPPWMQERLVAAGMRPINNIVDITNYVMLEWGQPLHAFDLALLRGRKIVVRRARPGETLTTIDGVERPLEEGMLLITDAGEPIAVAGVMGGAASEVSEDTTAVLIESANFNRASIRRTSASLRMRTEASLRFDKGISPALAPLALRRATKLMVELAGGKAAQGIIDVYPGKKESLPIRLTRAHVRRLLSLELSTAEVTGTLKRLGFTCRKGGDQDILVNVPYWRTDVEMAEDLVEEIARIIGYDSLPTTMLSGSLPAPQENHLRTLKEKVRDILANCSLQEIITYSLTSQAALHNVFTSSQRITPIRVANPITNDQEYLRTTLRMGLLSTLAMNEWHEQDGIRIFEVGRVYWPREGDLPEEREMAAGLLSGSRQTASWWSKEETTEFFDVKGILESLGYRLGMGFTLEAGEEPFFQRGKMAQILVQGTPAGVVGEVDPQVLEAFQISSRPVYLFELDIGVLLASLPATRQYRPLLRFPSVTRDLALVVDARLPYQRVREIIQDFPLVSQVELFDVYRGEPIPDSQKSLAVRIVYQSSDRTLTEKEVYDIQEQILKRLEDEVGVRLRQ